MLPLSGFNGWTDPEILVCGGSTYGAFLNVGAELPASISCGRIAPLSATPAWAMEDMPLRRNMGDMVLLPDRTVLILNGAANGAQGWGNAQNPVLTPVLYTSTAAAGTRFQSLTATQIPRVYHSTANLLPDGRVLVAGSNTHQFYTLTGDLPTELRIEAFSPPYLSGTQPSINNPPSTFPYGSTYDFSISGGNPDLIEINMLSAPYTTHSFSQVKQKQKLLDFFLSFSIMSPQTDWTSLHPSLVMLAAPSSSSPTYPLICTIASCCCCCSCFSSTVYPNLICESFLQLAAAARCTSWSNLQSFLVVEDSSSSSSSWSSSSFFFFHYQLS